MSDIDDKYNEGYNEGDEDASEHYTHYIETVLLPYTRKMQRVVDAAQLLMTTGARAELQDALKNLATDAPPKDEKGRKKSMEWARSLGCDMTYFSNNPCDVCGLYQVGQKDWNGVCIEGASCSSHDVWEEDEEDDDDD
tara:strand:+ start:2164 stop:2577 length:414 start_codon:yes stop_codon:yes gene_type:complete